eukprot:gene154-32868_t
MSTGGAPAGLAAAAQHMAATAAAAAGGGGGGGGGAASAAAAPFIIPAGCAGATPPVADLQAVNIVHQHLVMTWRIPRRYTGLKFLAVGGNGEVAQGIDSVTGKQRIKDPWKTVPRVGQPDYECGLRAYRELRLLRYMRDSWGPTCSQGRVQETTGVQHENIVCMIDCFVVPNTLDPEELDLFLVQAHAGMDLHNMLAKKYPVTREHIQLILYQVVRGLAFLHSAGIIHRDIKPGNIAVSKDLEVRILDFGMARIKSGVGGPVGAAAPVQPAAAPMMTDYVSTRYYRAPEIITNAGMYDGAVDMWSVGCILAELVSGRILFTGHNHLMQVMLITQLLGMPTTEFLQAIPSEGTRNFMASIPQFLALQGQPAPTRRPLSTVTYKNAAGVDVPMFGTFTQADPEIDLLERIFVFDPRQRITAAQALQHPYFASLHDEMDEPFCPGVFSSEFEGYNCSAHDWFKLVCMEIHAFRQRTDIPK